MTGEPLLVVKTLRSYSQIQLLTRASGATDTIYNATSEPDATQMMVPEPAELGPAHHFIYILGPALLFLLFFSLDFNGM
jgi:hypothetical protein